MSNANIYQKIISNPLKISFLDIFGGSRDQHSESDKDYAMIAGTTLDTVQNELGMLQKWQQPWLYMRIILVGFAISAIMVGAVGIMIVLEGMSIYPALNLLVIMVPPCIVPISMMIFFWEMNAPRDISLMQMIGYFAAGGVLSILLTFILSQYIPMYHQVMAPLTEEPGKLAASLFFLNRIQKKRGKVYGFTGLAIGAAVGAGFAAFESAQYAYNCLPALDLGDGVTAAMLSMDWPILLQVVDNILLRNVCAFSSHVLYTAPYVCIAALNMEHAGSSTSSVMDKKFLGIFVLACVSHAVWNSGFLMVSAVTLILKLMLFTVGLWSVALYGIRLSFKQLADKIQVTPTAGNVFSKLKIQGTRGVHAGVAFSLSSNEIVIGTDSSCKLTYPVNLSQISKQHCKLLVQNGTLYLADLGTQSGTYLNGSKLPALKGYPLKAGDRFCIGGNDQEFVVM